MTDDRFETLESLLQSIDDRLRRIESNTAGAEAAAGDIYTKLTELQQVVDPIDGIARD